MPDLLLFVEDTAQERLVGGLAARMAHELGVPVNIRARSARGGYAKVLGQLQDYAADVEAGRTDLADGIIIAADANCQGYLSRRNDILRRLGKYSNFAVCAIPDPHIERWFLLDSSAFKRVVGHGCKAPDEKCEKERYKRMLNQAVLEAGVEPLLGGIEYAEDLVRELNFQTAGKDDSFGRFLTELRNWLNRQIKSGM
jgi:hypothetical protein